MAALTQWKTAGMLVDSGCTDQIVTDIDAFLDFLPIQSVVRNPNEEASRVVGSGCANATFKPEHSIIKLSIFGCTVFMRKRDRDVNKLEPKALEG